MDTFNALLQDAAGVSLSTLRQILKANLDINGKYQGPLQTITDFLHISHILDDEWKRALVLGLVISLASILFIVLSDVMCPEHDSEPDVDDIDTWTFAGLSTHAAGALDGGSAYLVQTLEQVRPSWWNEDVRQGAISAMNIYAQISQEWRATYPSRFPFVLNAALTRVYQEMQEERKRKDALVSHHGTTLTNTIEQETILSHAHHFLILSMASYSVDLKSAGIMRKHVIYANLGPRKSISSNGDGGQPITRSEGVLRHVLFLDHLSHSIVLMIRGTADVTDVLADLNAREVPFLGGVAHEGVLEAANTVLEHVKNDLQKTLQLYEDYNLVFTGHSLGAGAAILCALTILANRMPWGVETRRVRCFAFAPPPVVSHSVVEFVQDHMTEIYCFVRDYDVVPRTSLRGVENVMRLWTAFDGCEEFTLQSRVKVVVGVHKLSEFVMEEEIVSKLGTVAMPANMGLANTTTTPRTIMYIPGMICWLIPENFGHPEGDWKSYWLKSQEFANACDIMFAGPGLGFTDHAATSYRQALESLTTIS